MTRNQRAFTKTELIVVLSIIGFVLVVCTGVCLPLLRYAKDAEQQLRDSQNVRDILNALVVYSKSNDNQYPLPSGLDHDNTTVSELGTSKNTSANIYSILLYNGLVTTETLVSSREHGNVRRYADYELSMPQAATNPAEALWDPAFRTDFTGKKPGGVSYAHMLPGGTRINQWAYTFKSEQVIVANRGPHVDSVSYDENGRISSIAADPDSKATRMHGRTSWSGSIGYNDTHVKFEKQMTGRDITYLNADGRPTADVIFYDEPDDPTATNAFLSLFTTAGDLNKDFTSIWD